MTTNEMNVRCVNCKELRMLARVRVGSATPMFHCALTKKNRTHLMPGNNPDCFTEKDGDLVSAQVVAPEEFKS